ncbi:carbohydrate ABC transporter permease [Roseomonas sp. CECT 9278]|uniref:carbohydrate ABC transporter permease n=1 Tax=Roseomonas sp. CECT 9278 TaxID=2845823 RepID=UPI001E4006B6|nr:sugar ABC transporter permease [Roseomonas sp. CECT 9278]CAH0259916.1 Trehalose transport system permease protein SugA [Roseomonas sp. CECT 9278]
MTAASVRRHGVERARTRFFQLCLAPSLAVLAVITLAPAVFLLVSSLTPLDLTRPETVGDFSRPLENFRLMLADGRLGNSVWVQAKLSFWTVLLQLLIGFGLALLLNSRDRMIEALRTVFLIPMVLPPIVVAIIWKVIYTPDISPMHWGLSVLGVTIPSLITDPDWALTAIIIADTWQWFPFTMLMTLAALQMMPQELIDAAKVDGASAWQMTWHVTLPFLRGVLLVAGLFRLIDSIKAFPLIFILTDGGPGSLTEVTNYYSFQQAFNFSLLGYSSAITVVLLAASIALSWVIIRAIGWGHRD